MFGELCARDIDEVLRSEVVGRVGCVAEGWPYVVPVTYVYDGESVYAHSAEGLKVRAMRANPLVCFEVEQIRSWTDWRTVVARGHFEELWRDEEEHAMDLLATRFATVNPSDTARLDRHEGAHRNEDVRRPILFRIRLVDRTGRFERR